jgi:hypothetical protein
LTRNESGQDRDPFFAPDGATIVFTHETGGGAKEWWSIEPKGGGLKRLEAVPEWYQSAKGSPYFTNLAPKDWPEDKRGPGEPGREGEEPSRFRAPDGSVELVLGEVEGDEANDYGDMPGHGKHYLLRDLKAGTETKMGDLPGFEGLWELLHLNTDAREFFWFQGPMRLAFFGLHLNSTEGDTCYALDLKGRRFVRLSPNWAAPIPLPGEPAFLTLTEERLLEILGSTKKANCSYIERWDTEFKEIKYVKDGTAPICYGASMYRPGKTPAVVFIRDDGT